MTAVFICIYLKSKCVSCNTSGLFDIQRRRQWPEPDLTSVLTHALAERKCLGHNHESVFWSVFKSLLQSNWNCSVFLASFIGIKLPSYGRYFCPGKGKKGNQLLCCVGLKVNQNICAYVCRLALLSFPFVALWRSYSAWLLCITSLSLHGCIMGGRRWPSKPEFNHGKKFAPFFFLLSFLFFLVPIASVSLPLLPGCPHPPVR